MMMTHKMMLFDKTTKMAGAMLAKGMVYQKHCFMSREKNRANKNAGDTTPKLSLGRVSLAMSVFLWSFSLDALFVGLMALGLSA